MNPTLAFLLTRLLWTMPLLLVCGAAAFRGGAWERFVAATFAVADIGSVLAAKPQWRHLTGLSFAIETAFLGCLYLSALFSRRWWPMLATAAQTLAVLMFVASTINPHIWLKAYYFGNIACSYLILVALAFGVLVEARWARWRNKHLFSA